MSIILDALKKAAKEGTLRKLPLERKESLTILNRSRLRGPLLLSILIIVPLALLWIYFNNGSGIHQKSEPVAAPLPSSSITVEIPMPRQKGYDHHQTGIRLFKEGRFSEAEKEFLRAIEINPEFVEAHNNLGLAYWRQGKKTQAIERYKKSLDMKPDYAEAMNNLAIIYDNDGRYEEAVQLYVSSLKLKPDYAEAHLNCAISLEKAKRLVEARDHYQAFLDLAGSSGADRELLDKVKRRIEALPHL